MTAFSLSGLLIAGSGAILGALVFLSAPKRELNRYYGVFCAVISLWGTISFVLGTDLSRQEALFIWRLAHVSIVLIATCFYLVVCSLCKVRERQVRRAVFLFTLVSLGIVGSKEFISDVRRAFPSIYYTVPGPIYYAFFFSWNAIVVWCHRLLWERYRSVEGTEKRRIRLFFFATLGSFFGGSFNFLPVFGIDLYPWGNFLVPAYSVVMVYAIFVYRFFDIEVVVRKTLAYSLLAGLITATYLVMVLVMEKWFQGFLGYRSLVATVIVAFLIAAGFNPLRDRVQAFLDRALFKGTMAELAAQRERLLAEVRKTEQMKAVGTLAAGLAHEIKNPLASIKTFTECLDQKHTDPAFLEKFKRIVGGEVERINLIVQQLLDFAKPVPPKLTPVELGHLLDTTLELLNSEILQRHVEVKRVYGTRARVLGDPQQLEQVFLNLVLNSLQAMDGSGSLEIRTDLEAAELRVTIRDDGTGIDPKLLPHVFDPFFTTKETGTGLGLAVVQGIVKEHGGRVVVTSQPGTGTTVNVYLPAAV